MTGFRKRLGFLAPALALVVGSASSASAQELDATSARAVRAFEQVCLANAASLSAARSAATSAPWSFTSEGGLPSLTGKKPMETFSSDGVEMLLRPGKKEFGCLILFKLPQGAKSGPLAQAIGALPGLSTKGDIGEDPTRVNWTAAAPKGSKVVLTADYGPAGNTVILALESKGSPG